MDWLLFILRLEVVIFLAVMIGLLIYGMVNNRF